MGQIKSDAGAASTIATNINAGTATVLGYSAATKDGSSTITGNVTNASPLIDSLSNSVNQIATGIESFSDCVTQIDGNFQEKDSEIATTVSGLTGWSSDTAKTNRSSGANANGTGVPNVSSDTEAFN
ncbi:TIGR04197 family type VII secretion effector [Streptococcus mutans]|jgi:hypothetical protein|uniref:TIGR04197 family type VII secretion effector n=1 Tax=Streptococcus mutans TaxID=1309 RepID=UPI0002B4E5A1|nr:TIGR04197 family type VII secretion effector [Streptococcus mutans]EMB77405.1 hypothetical protein SMU44_08679 [Streptococcus mutans 11VS1]AVM72351.1 TIGR04197 family type VII secretion effector [Streptococcus mutans]EMB63277.1 hypothetical protein SMU26_10123 [Streptococcus mutans 3SN1]EMB98599.1 hypothetical protein SMU68_10138 [Streptococcus mutans NFSM1]EMC19933.1 hypothetical protein SMU80_08870 [Streptococcus mutans SF1]